MKVNIPINTADIITLIIVAIIMVGGVRVVIGFFKKPKAPIAGHEDDTFQAGDKIELTVDGMQCGMCEIHIKDAIREAVPDAKKLSANHTKGKADFTLESSISRKDLEQKLHDTIDPSGYRLLGLEAV